ASALTAGRFECRAPGGWPIARALLPAIPPYVSIVTPARLPAEARGLDGLWYGVLGDSIVAWAIVDAGKPGVSVFYAWVTSGTSRGGGVYAAEARDEEVKATLPNKAVLAVSRRDARTSKVTFTPPASESNFGITARRAEP